MFPADRNSSSEVDEVYNTTALNARLCLLGGVRPFDCNNDLGPSARGPCTCAKA
jgi:hypothetical protein